jgi:hypothetical protein
MRISFDSCPEFAPAGAVKVAATVFLAVLLMVSAAAPAVAKAMTCRLSSEKVVGGREKQCLYVCEDKSIEGRTRAVSSSCPRTVQSTTR